MQHETLLLKGLFAACLLTCTLVLGAMFITPIPVQPATATLAANATCAHAVGNAACPLPRS